VAIEHLFSNLRSVNCTRSSWNQRSFPFLQTGKDRGHGNEHADNQENYEGDIPWIKEDSLCGS